MAELFLSTPLAPLELLSLRAYSEVQPTYNGSTLPLQSLQSDSGLVSHLLFIRRKEMFRKYRWPRIVGLLELAFFFRKPGCPGGRAPADGCSASHTRGVPYFFPGEELKDRRWERLGASDGLQPIGHRQQRNSRTERSTRIDSWTRFPTQAAPGSLK